MGSKFSVTPVATQLAITITTLTLVSI